MKDILHDIEQYENGPDLLDAALSGLRREHLHAKPGPGAWSIHEVVIHLTDSDAVSIERMKRIVAMDAPQLLNYDESAFIRRLHPAEQSIEDAQLLFRVNRRQWCRALRCFKPADFDRVGNHSVSGPKTLGQMIPMYIDHLVGHLRYIEQKRNRLGVPINMRGL